MNVPPIELLVLDVDGVLTDGHIVNGPDGEVCKFFHSQDGYAIKLYQRCGGTVALVTGRDGEVIRYRAAELGVEQVHTGVSDKLAVFESVLTDVGCAPASAAYVGDDLPDLGPMGRCGFAVAVANAVPAVKRVAEYVTRRRGGEGAVAEVIELILRKRNRWRRDALA